MKNKLFLILILVFGFSTTLSAQDSTQVIDKTKIAHGIHFVDNDGDGFNDNAPDHDNDGIPNGLDQDYKRGMRAQALLESKSANSKGIGKGAKASKKWNGRKRFVNCPIYTDSTSTEKN